MSSKFQTAAKMVANILQLLTIIYEILFEYQNFTSCARCVKLNTVQVNEIN